MNEALIIGLVGVSCGLFCLVCAAKDYDWFMNNRKARTVCRLFGRKGARIFYMLLGSVITLVGAFALIAYFFIEPPAA